jgi:hypothetical protein
MNNFESKIDGIFDFDIAEEVKKDDAIVTEGIIEKAKEMAKKAASFGLEKVFPPEVLSFVQGLFAAAKQGPEAVAEFLVGADQGKVESLISATSSGAPEAIGAAVKKSTENSKDTIEEDAAEIAGELAQKGQEASQAISSGASTAEEVLYWILVAMGLAASFGLYKVVRAGVDIYKQTNKAMGAKARRGRGRRR